MSDSTDIQELYSRASRSQTGLPLIREMDGKSMLTQDKHGTMPWLTSEASPLQCNSLVKDKSQISSNGSDLSSSVRVPHQDSSTMRFQSQLGSDMRAISTTQRNSSIHSPRPIKNNKSTSVSTPGPQKVEPHSRLNSTLLLTSLPRLFASPTWSTHMKWEHRSQASHISRDFGLTTESTHSEVLSPELLHVVPFLKPTLTPL